MLAAPPTPVERLGDLISNVRAFDGLARQVWGGDAAVTTLQMDEALARAEKARIAVRETAKIVIPSSPLSSPRLALTAGSRAAQVPSKAPNAMNTTARAAWAARSRGTR